MLCKPRAEISLEWLSHKRGAAIKDLSQKAESTLTAALEAAVGLKEQRQPEQLRPRGRFVLEW